MKVLITTDWYKPAINGVVTSVCNLREELQQRGHEVKILTLSRTARSYEEEGVIYMGSVNAGYIYPGARFRVSPGRELYCRIIEWQPDIVHSQCEFSTFFMAKRIAEECKIPLVHTYHTVYEDYTHYFSPYKKWGRDMVQFLTRRISEKVDSMIAPSTKIETLLKGYKTQCPVSVIPSGIDLEKYAAQSRTGVREQIRRKYGIAKETTVLLYVGRLAKEKNLEELLEYQQKVQESGTMLMIVGGGPYLEILRKKAAELGVMESVIFTGMVSPEEVASYYPAGDLFISASTSETQGLTYAEALAAGLPLLCRKDECLRAVVEEGKNGWQYRTEEEFLKDLKSWKEKEYDERRGMCNYAKQSAEIFSKKDLREVWNNYTNDNSKKNGPKEKSTWQKAVNIASWVSLILCGILAVWGYQSGIFQSVETMQQFVNRFGMVGALIFVLIQIVQVVFPIIPGGISCLAGVLLFGAIPGFFYNYIGICVGSCIAFGIARSLGRPVLYKMFSEKMIEKYLTWTEQKGRFLKLFALAIFLPVAPDDFLCYLAGTTNMTWKQFVAVIFLGKPFSIALYSLGLTTLFQVIFHLA